jgi:hypothetical protein
MFYKSTLVAIVQLKEEAKQIEEARLQLIEELKEEEEAIKQEFKKEVIQETQEAIEEEYTREKHFQEEAWNNNI